jgi:hypothetical protein
MKKKITYTKKNYFPRVLDMKLITIRHILITI